MRPRSCRPRRTDRALFEYYKTLNQYRVEASLARTLCDQAADGLAWLQSLGVEFRPEHLYASGVESIPRGHAAHGNGAAIAAQPDRAVSTRAIDVALNTRVTRLLTDEDGRVVGIQAGADIVGHNRGLLLTTPNFHNVLEAFVPGWLVYVNREGRRFVKETGEYAVMSGVVQAQTGGSCFAVFDEAARQAAAEARRND